MHSGVLWQAQKLPGETGCRVKSGLCPPELPLPSSCVVFVVSFLLNINSFFAIKKVKSSHNHCYFRNFYYYNTIA